jgi:hypothetical protein
MSRFFYFRKKPSGRVPRTFFDRAGHKTHPFFERHFTLQAEILPPLLRAVFATLFLCQASGFLKTFFSLSNLPSLFRFIMPF